MAQLELLVATWTSRLCYVCNLSVIVVFVLAFITYKVRKVNVIVFDVFLLLRFQALLIFIANSVFQKRL